MQRMRLTDWTHVIPLQGFGPPDGRHPSTNNNPIRSIPGPSPVQTVIERLFNLSIKFKFCANSLIACFGSTISAANCRLAGGKAAN
jgi:hypothetical protein